MAGYSKIISGLATKIEKLMQVNTARNQKNVDLTTTNSELKSQFAAQKARIGELEEELRITKLAKSVSGSSNSNDSKNLKLKINEYVREIDKCIANLNK